MAMDQAGEKRLWQQFSNFLLVSYEESTVCASTLPGTLPKDTPTYQSKGCFTIRWRDDALCKAEPYQVGICTLYCDWPKTTLAVSLSPTLGSQLVSALRPSRCWACHNGTDSCCLLQRETESSLHGILSLNSPSSKALWSSADDLNWSNSFWPILFPYAPALWFYMLPLLAHVFWVLLYPQVCPCFSLPPHSLFFFLEFLLYSKQRTLWKNNFMVKTWKGLLAKRTELAKQTSSNIEAAQCLQLH